MRNTIVAKRDNRTMQGGLGPMPPFQTASAQRSSAGALILGGDCGALGAARSLGRQGIEVGFLPASNTLAGYSRFTSWQRAWPGADSPDAVGWLIDFAKSQDPKRWALFPAGDGEVRLVSQNYHELAPWFRLTTPPWEQTRWAADKRLTYQRAAQLGIAHPRTYTVSTVAEAENVDCHFPLVIKPAEKQGVNALTKSKAWQAHNREELVRLFGEGSNFAGNAGLIVQELIPGEDSDQFSYCATCQDGIPLITMAARRTRQSPTGFGTGCFVESIEEHGFDAAAEQFIASIDYTGMIEIEFKLDRRDNRFKLLDVNPRLWTWNGLGPLAGVDFSLAMWDICHGEKVSRASAKAGASWFYAARYIPEALKKIMTGRLEPLGYLGSLLGATGCAAFAWDDMLPALAYPPFALFRWLFGNR